MIWINITFTHSPHSFTLTSILSLLIADSHAAFSDAEKTITAVSEAMGVHFKHSAKYGNVTVDPSRVGAALVSHTSVTLAQLTSDDVPTARAICASYGATFSMSETNRRGTVTHEGQLCQTEADLAASVHDCIVALVSRYGDVDEY